jgi:hypothetical protein
MALTMVRPFLEAVGISGASVALVNPGTTRSLCLTLSTRTRPFSHRASPRMAASISYVPAPVPLAFIHFARSLHGRIPSRRSSRRRSHITFRTADGWTAPLDVGNDVNEAGSNIEARRGSEHQTLYFGTNTVPPVSFPRLQEQAQRDLAEMQVWANGRENTWYVFLVAWLKRARQP